MSGPIFLEGGTVTLRPVESEDTAFVQQVMNDPAVWRPALDVDPMSYEQAEEFIDTVVGSDGIQCLVCADGEQVGFISLDNSQHGPDETSRSRDAELAYWIAPEHQGQGYGSDAAARMIQYAFEDRNLRRISARLGSFNEASAGLLESLGFVHEGTLREAAWYRGAYHDVLWYGLLREEWQADREGKTPNG